MGAIDRSPWRRVVNPFRPVEILSADQVEAIHRASLRILSEIGLEVLGAAALDRFAADGAAVDRGTRTVRLDPARVEELVALAPPAFTLHARNPRRDIQLGGADLVFCSVGGPAFVSDLDRGRRPGNHADFLDYVRLIGTLDILHQEGGGPLEPTDLPVATRHLDMYHALATLLDKTWHCLGAGRTVVEDAIEVAAIVRGVDRDRLALEPSLITIINTNSPLRLDGPMSDGLIAMAEAGQAVVATPFTLAGAMTPVTLAAALAQQNAEALFCIALTQLVRPGAPVVYGVDNALSGGLPGRTARDGARPGPARADPGRGDAGLRAASRHGGTGARMDYAFDAGRAVRVIVLDTVRRDVGSGGVLAPAQTRWLRHASSPRPARGGWSSSPTSR